MDVARLVLAPVRTRRFTKEPTEPMSGTHGGTKAVRETVAFAGRRDEHDVRDGRIGRRICAMRTAFFRVEWLR